MEYNELIVASGAAESSLRAVAWSGDVEEVRASLRHFYAHSAALAAVYPGVGRARTRKAYGK